MRVFVTGATGFIGSAVVRELLVAGHQVVGLARSDDAAQVLTAAGATAHRGTLTDLESLQSGAGASEGVIHLAYIHDFANYAAAAHTDMLAVQALGAALTGTQKPLVITSGIAVLTPGHLGTEVDMPNPNAVGALRIPSEQAALATQAQGVRASVVRLPPTVHGQGDHAFIPALIGIAKANGTSAYVGDGHNRWPAVHRLDAAKLFRLALEHGIPGAVYHGVADEGVPFLEIAARIGKHLNVPVSSKSPQEAAEYFSWLAHFASLDIPASSALTQQQLNWHPTQPALLQDLDAGHYFA